MKISQYVSLLVLVLVSHTSLADLVVPTDRVRNHVKIFEAPQGSSDVIGRLNVGGSIEFVDNVPKWREVRLQGGQSGFVSKSWTRVIRELQEREEDELRIHYLNVGAGTCTIVECPGPDGPPMIIDCGSLGGTPADLDSDGARNYLQNILGKHQASPNLVLSHADRDHYGLIAHVLSGTQTQNIWQGGDPDNYTADGFPVWRDNQEAGGARVKGELDENFHGDGNPISDSELDCGEASVFILTVNSGDSKNGDSLVVEIHYDDFGATFTGDAEGDTEGAAIENFDGNVKTTVLSGSHHGARTHRSNSVQWANATFPEVVIFSAGRKFGHPQCTAVNRFQGSLATTPLHPTQCGISSHYQPVISSHLAMYMTEINGTIVVTSNGSSPLSLFCDGSDGCDVNIAH